MRVGSWLCGSFTAGVVYVRDATLIADADLGGELVKTQLCALPAHWRAVQERGASRQRSGPEEHQTAGRWLQACCDLEHEAVPLAMQGVTQAPIWRAQVLDRDPFTL